MAGGMLGANTGELRALSGRFTARDATSDTARSTCSPAVAGVRWEGPDAEAFKADWRTVVDTAIRELGDLLEARAKALTQQAADQDTASEGKGGAGGDQAGGQQGGDQSRQGGPQQGPNGDNAENKSFWDFLGDPFSGGGVTPWRHDWGSPGGWPLYSEFTGGLKWGPYHSENMYGDGSKEWSPKDGKWVPKDKSGHDAKNQVLFGGFFNFKALGTDKEWVFNTPVGPIGVATHPRLGADGFLGLDYRTADREARLGGKIFGGVTVPFEANWSKGPFDFNLNASANAGAGAEATSGFSWKDGKLSVKPRVGLTWGVGGNVGGGVTVDTKPFAESLRSYLPSISPAGITEGESVTKWKQIIRGENPFTMPSLPSFPRR